MRPEGQLPTQRNRRQSRGAVGAGRHHTHFWVSDDTFGHQLIVDSSLGDAPQARYRKGVLQPK